MRHGGGSWDVRCAGGRQKRHRRLKSGDVFVRCVTDGDFVITAAALKNIRDLPADLRQQALNRAILCGSAARDAPYSELVASEKAGRARGPSVGLGRCYSFELTPWSVRRSASSRRLPQALASKPSTGQSLRRKLKPFRASGIHGGREGYFQRGDHPVTSSGRRPAVAGPLRLSTPGTWPVRHVWTALRWQGLFGRFCKAGRCGHVFDLLMRRTWAAGHNAFRGDRSRPTSTRSKTPWRIVGFPAPGIDRLIALPPVCPSQACRRSCAGSLCGPQHRFPIWLAAGHDRPDHPRHLVGECHCSDLGRSTRHELNQPRSACSVSLGIADNGESADHQHLPQVSVTLLGNPAEPLLAAA